MMPAQFQMDSFTALPGRGMASTMVQVFHTVVVSSVLS